MGYDRIEGEQVKLGYTIDRSTIRHMWTNFYTVRASVPFLPTTLVCASNPNLRPYIQKERQQLADAVRVPDR